jgi:hypothetical protein
VTKKLSVSLCVRAPINRRYTVGEVEVGISMF